MAEQNKKNLNHEMFTNKDGYVEGGKEIEMTNPSETQEEEVQGQGNILAEKKEKLSGTNMWLSALKIAAQAGSKIYANKTEAKMAMSEAQLLHAERQARGEEAYQGKLLEARQSDWKDEFVLIILSAPIIVLAWAVLSDDPDSDGEGEVILRVFLNTTVMVYKPVDPCRGEYFWYKGNTDI